MYKDNNEIATAREKERVDGLPKDVVRVFGQHRHYIVAVYSDYLEPL